MAQVQTQPETISREAAIEALRTELARRADGEMSICRLAAEKGIFCKGFQQYSDVQLRKHYGWIAKRYPRASRDEFEQLADKWQMARQEVDEVPTSCDVQQTEHDACGGWSDFPPEALSRFLLELTGRRVTVSAD